MNMLGMEYARCMRILGSIKWQWRHTTLGESACVTYIINKRGMRFSLKWVRFGLVQVKKMLNSCQTIRFWQSRTKLLPIVTNVRKHAPCNKPKHVMDLLDDLHIHFTLRNEKCKSEVGLKGIWKNGCTITSNQWSNVISYDINHLVLY